MLIIRSVLRGVCAGLVTVILGRIFGIPMWCQLIMAMGLGFLFGKLP